MSGMRSMGKDVGGRVATKLAELQGSRTDGQMADILGCTRPYYWQVKNGQRSISYEMLKRGAVTFPELRDIVVEDLTGVA